MSTGQGPACWSGNNGFFICNEIVWRLLSLGGSPDVTGLVGELRPYVGPLAYGRIFSRATI